MASKTVNILSSNDIEVQINNQPLYGAQAIQIGASVDDIVMEAKFICVDFDIEPDEGEIVKEIHSVGLVEDIAREGDKVIFKLQIQEGAPSAEYFRGKFYGEV